MAWGRLGALGFDSYEEYLRSPHWRERRRTSGLAANWTCACGRRATQIHHRTYERVGRERDGDLRAVCEDCHGKIHRWVNDEGMALADATDAVLLGIDPVPDGPRVSKRARKRQRRHAKKQAPKLQGAWDPSGIDGAVRRRAGLPDKPPRAHPVVKKRKKKPVMTEAQRLNNERLREQWSRKKKTKKSQKTTAMCPPDRA